MYEPFELSNILAKKFCRFVIERIVGIWFVKQVDETVNDGINIQDWFPVLSQNVQAHFALQINVGMINLGLAFDFGRRVRIVRGNLERKVVGSTLPVARVGADRDLKRGEIVGIGKANFRNLSSI